jgi:hypothetical protein
MHDKQGGDHYSRNYDATTTWSGRWGERTVSIQWLLRCAHKSTAHSLVRRQDTGLHSCSGLASIKGLEDLSSDGCLLVLVCCNAFSGPKQVTTLLPAKQALMLCISMRGFDYWGSRFALRMRSAHGFLVYGPRVRNDTGQHPYNPVDGASAAFRVCALDSTSSMYLEQESCAFCGGITAQHHCRLIAQHKMILLLQTRICIFAYINGSIDTFLSQRGTHGRLDP